MKKQKIFALVSHAVKSRYRRVSYLLPLLFFVTITIAHADDPPSDPYRYRDSGQLTEIDKDFVTISDKGYAVDPSALIVDRNGKPTSLDRLSPQTNVDFEYSYQETRPKTMSPVIVYVEESQE